MPGPVYYDILIAVRDQVISQNLMPSVDGVKAVPEPHIQIWMAPALNVGKEKWQDAPTPGLLISPSRTVRVPPGAGTTSFDDVHYPVLLQIVDREVTRDSLERIKALLTWSENLRKYFNQQNLRLAVYGSGGTVDIGYISSQDILDERLFGFHHQCLSYIPLTYISREPRDQNGSL